MDLTFTLYHKYWPDSERDPARIAQVLADYFGTKAITFSKLDQSNTKDFRDRINTVTITVSAISKADALDHAAYCSLVGLKP